MASGPNWKSVDGAWNAVDGLIEATLLGEDAALARCAARADQEGLPDIAVTPAQGKLLSLIAGLIGARSILEVGTLGGYSTIWLARGVGEGGSVVSLERDPHHAEVARANIADAGLAERVEVLTGAALDTLPGLNGPFDIAFIDADKVNNAAYVDHALRLVRVGGLIVVDNVVREGRILDPQPGDEAALASRTLYDHVAASPRLDATAIQTVGAKGWDGMLVARVLS